MTLRDVPERQRFELTDDGALIGFIDYFADNSVVTMTHAEVDPRFGGRGHGSEMVRQALDIVRASERRVIPLCSFVAAYVRRHPEYADLVTGGM